MNQEPLRLSMGMPTSSELEPVDGYTVGSRFCRPGHPPPAFNGDSLDRAQRPRWYSLLMDKRVKISRRRGFTRVSSKRQVTIPKNALEATGLGPGDELKVDVDEAGRIVLSPADSLIDRRQAIERTSGSLARVYRPGGLEQLRDEWR
jgi:AbrB family looped-hinge helix DNA binding protein